MPPTASSYIAGIDVITRNADGFCTPLESESVKIRYVGGADIMTVISGNQGAIEGQLLPSVQSETAVEFYSATKTGTLRMMTARTPESAYSISVTLILDDVFTDTQNSKFADIYLRDKTFPNVALIFLGTQKRGSTIPYPYETAKAKEVEIIAHSHTERFQFSTDTPTNSLFASLTVNGIYDLKFSRRAVSLPLDLNTPTPQTFYTVPDENNFIFTKAVFSDASESLIASTESVLILDRNGAVIMEQAIADFSSPDDFKKPVLMQSAIYRAGDNLQLQMSGAYGSAATLNVDIFGYLRRAG